MTNCLRLSIVKIAVIILLFLPSAVFAVETVKPPITEESFVIEELRLKYLSSKEVADSLRELLSPSGKITEVRSSNSVIVKDSAAVVRRVKELMALMDKKPLQVMIEGKIVELNSSRRKEIGVDWEGGYSDNQVFGQVGSIESGFSINLPRGAEGEAPPEGITLNFARLSVDRFTLDLRLSALEDSGEAKVLSSPQILVLENEEADISSGQEIVVPVSETAIAISKEGRRDDKPLIFEAKLALKVKPRIIDEENVSLLIETKNEDFNFANKVRDFPTKVTRAAKTNLIVKDGETVVIGGVNKKAESKGERGVPILSKIPLLGRLFRKSTGASDTTELMIFLTPKVVREGK